MNWPGIILSSTLLALTLRAQQGDEGSEAQTPRVPADRIPPAPVVPPDQALKTFKLQPGFRVELVAAEPLVHNPIQVAFDPDGRLWVLEMRGYMADIDGRGELDRTGDVAVLEDTDGDGRMDKRTVFLEGLVLPRALALVRGGALVAEPPNLWFCRDTNSDLHCDQKTPVADDYAVQADPKLGARANIEHAPNGLLPALDNWIYNANHTTRFRYADGAWQRESTAFRGQWGISQDDFGRLFYNSNEDPLRADFVPAEYFRRNPHLQNPAGVNVPVYSDKSVWPVRVNPGVNRGYRPGQLRPDGTLATFTAACAPLVYRGDNFPRDVEGSVFVCEPAGNLVRRFVLEEQGVGFKAANAYDHAEFLASVDERFRPVSLANGPDGCLYVVDMYHGILQHRIYVTSYLRRQILDRNLDKPTDLGRIYRVVSDSHQRRPAAALSRAAGEDLVQALSDPNGWRRDTAQRLLVERNNPADAPALRKSALSAANPLGRLHALWTLEGTRRLDADTLTRAMADAHPRVRAAAIRISEPLLKNQPELLHEVLKHSDDPAPVVQLQVAFSLGEVSEPRAEGTLAALALRHAADPCFRDAVLSGLGGRELEFLERLLTAQGWQAEQPGADRFLGALARCVFNEAQPPRLARLFDLAADRASDWQRLALLDGILRTAPTRSKSPVRIKPVRLHAEPPGLAALARSPAPEVQERVRKIAELATWPGKPGAAPEPEVKPLTAEEQKRFDQGRELFLVSCGACHQPHGKGQEGLAPPLLDSEWVLGPPARVVRIVLHGMHGPVHVKGRTFQLDMPALGVFDDDQVAAILTYVRREWGHTANPVEPDFVRKIRAETEKREEAWTEAELLNIP